MKFVLPYIIRGETPTRSFMEVSGFDSISAAAASAEETLRAKYTVILKRRVCVAVAEVDFSNLDRETGRPLPPTQPQRPWRTRKPYRRW